MRPAAISCPPDDRDLRLGGADLRRLAAGRARPALAGGPALLVAGWSRRLACRGPDRDRGAGASAGPRDQRHPRRRRPDRRSRRWWPGGCRTAAPGALRTGLPVALVVLVALAIPFAVSGRWGLLGVGFNNDLGLHLAWAEWLRSGFGPAPDAGYPLGPHGLAVATAAVPGIGLGQAFVGEIVAIGVLTGLTALGALREMRPGPAGRSPRRWSPSPTSPPPTSPRPPSRRPPRRSSCSPSPSSCTVDSRATAPSRGAWALTAARFCAWVGAALARARPAASSSPTASPGSPGRSRSSPSGA